MIRRFLPSLEELLFKDITYLQAHLITLTELDNMTFLEKRAFINGVNLYSEMLQQQSSLTELELEKLTANTNEIKK